MATLALLMWLGLSAAQAQLLVQLQMAKRTFVAYEPLTATVVVSNRAGKDIVLGGPKGQGSWLMFQIATVEGQSVVPPYGPPQLKPTVLQAGESVKHTFSLGKHYPLSAQGRYTIKAGAWFADFNQYAMSSTAVITIAEGNTFWEQTCGVPLGNNRSQYLRYSLLSFNENEQMSVYTRLKDERSGRVLATYPLGRLVPHRDPQATLDSDNNCHVLFMTGPRTYRRCIVAPDGQLLKNELFEERDGSPPMLMLASTGKVNVRGGVAFDPSAPPVEPEETIHDLSERPVGVPEYFVKD